MRNLKVVALFSLLLFVISTSAHAEYRVPSSLDENEKSEYISEKHHEIIGIQINKASLEQITKELGESEIYKGTHTASHVCYKNDYEELEFSVSSLGFGYTVSLNGSNTVKCKELKSKFINGAGLKIGLSKSETISLAGKPSKNEGNKFTYIYWVQEKLENEAEERLRKAQKIQESEEIWMDVFSIINIYFDGNFVYKYSVNTTETY